MIIQYTKKEMIALARLALGYGSSRDDMTEIHTDGLDVDALMERLAREWYTDLMDHAPLEMLNVSNITGAAAAFGNYVGGGTSVTLPPHCLRCAAIAFPGWSGSVTPAPHGYYETLKARQLNPYTAATDAFPAAAMGADGRTVHCWPALRLGAASSVAVRGVADTGTELYEFDESALASFGSFVAQRYKELCVNPSI